MASADTRYFEDNHERFLREWFEFLSFKSISADPQYAPDCLACAEWVRAHTSQLGFSAELWSSEGRPVVFAERPGNPNKPTILFYGHYDVQPADPLELWSSDPFKPEVRDGRVYARGAEDNKGQVFYVLKAIESLVKSDADLPTIKLLIEGEEESGSTALDKMLAERKKRLAAKILLVCDTGMVGPGRPTATVGLRGITALEARFFGPSVDLHSGVFGGVVVNPLQALVSVLSQLHAPDGSVAVPGFYDGLDEPNAEERRLSNQSPIDLAQISQQLGVPLVGGEKRFTPLERRGLRPTLEFNGVGGGYQGKGGKTVIPAEAFAKLSMRLVAGQEPKKILELVQNFIASKAPEGVRAEFTSREAGGAALKLSTDSPVLSLARRVSQESFGEELACLWEGASIPIIPKLAEVAGAEPLLVGFGMDEDKIHSPNESFSLRQFEEGFKFVAALLRIV